VTVDEIKKFLFACLVMGLNHQPEIKNYWNSKETNLGIFGSDFIQKLISRETWSKVNKIISFPIDLFLFRLNENFQKSWIPYQHVAIDEILVLFKGRFSGRQHIRGKPNSTGLKFFALCDEKGFFILFLAITRKR